MPRFFKFPKRNRIHIDAACEMLKGAAIMVASKKLEYTGFSGPTLMDGLEQVCISELAPAMTVFVKACGVTRVVSIRDNFLPVFQTIWSDWTTTDFYLQWGTKILTSDMNPSDLGIAAGATIMCSFRLRGGANTTTQTNPLFTTQSLSVEIENLIIRSQYSELGWLDLPLPLGEIQSLAHLTHEQVVTLIKTKDIEELQSSDESTSPRKIGWSIIMAQVSRGLKTLSKQQLIPGFEGGFSEIFEGLLILYHWHSTCKDVNDYYVLARTAYMCFTGNSLPQAIMARIIPEPEVQGFEEVVGKMRDIFDLSMKVTECGLVKRLKKMYTYFLVQGILSRMGMDVKEDEFVALSNKAKAVKFSSQTNMWVHIIETTIYICERIVSFRKTGSVEAFFQEGQECEQWLVESDRLLALAPFTANLQPHGTTYFRFLSDLNDAIDKGQGYAKAFRTLGADRTNPVMKKLGNLMLLKNAEVTKRASMKSRQAPFGVLVYGHSGVAKSSFMRVLYHAFGSIFNLERDDHYLYTRSPASEYWTNFDSSMWAIQMDDIAFLRPGACSDVDPTLKELLNVVNNVPYVPPQADLSDKGKTPVLAKLVMATTNCEDLNASEYFHCPLAVRRRLPYVIEVAPKRKYVQSNGIFINPDKLEASPGFPDYWDITVKKLVPLVENCGREMATLEVVERFNNIQDFVKHFGEAAKQHFINQDKGAAAEEFVKQVDLCPICVAYKEDCVCSTQVEIQSVWEGICYYAFWAYVKWLTWWFNFTWMQQCCAFVARYQWLRCWLTHFVIAYLPETQFVRVMSGLAHRVRDKRMQLSIAFLTLLATAFAVYTARKEETEEETLTTQGNVLGTTEDDLEKSPDTNVWYRDSVELMQFELPVPAGSLVGKTPEQLRSMFERNMVSVAIAEVGGAYRGNTRGFFYKGNFLVVNAHTLKREVMKLTILRGKREPGVTPIITVEVKKSDFLINPHNDMAMIQISSMPPARDLSKFWCDTEIPISKMVGFGRTKTGDVDIRTVWGVNLFHMPLKGLENEYPVLCGSISVETKGGDCGTLYMAETPRGFTFSGVHIAGYGEKVGAMRVLASELNAMVDQLSQDVAVVSGDGEPTLTLQGDVTLLNIHPKSVFRYLETGSGEIFGRLPGFLPKPKSKVCYTPFKREMEEHYDMKCNYTKPEMEGWLPVRNNVKEMVVPTVNYDRETLTKCKQSFLHDIVESLEDGWEGRLVELSNTAAVNGLPGVKYVDRLNINSSMGFPWNKTKKQFLEPCITEKYPDGVTFLDDVWEMVDSVERTYDQGHRAYPVFMGHLKDEPVTQAKRAACKTRLFAGGPVHWSIVVRKTLLSFVKMVQENKMTFEAGPGTVCQSIEWQQMREYITQFGDDKIIAGDYSKFDKHMIADFIMAAYWIIAQLHKRAGHDEAFCTRIMAIGTDTAYPLMNIKGELVMFYGTNPSGHPLTVIVNSLVNSLYMRYAYAKLGYDVGSFKQNVALMTYGDDNVMGVSDNVPHFNHTAVQKKLEEIGVVYTMADKESSSVPYIHVDDVAFLKRKWRFDEDIGAYVCPLDEDSIQKSLMCWLPSNTLVPEEQMVEVMKSAVNEYFWYGKSKFEKERNFLISLAHKEPYVFYVTDSTFPTWQELFDRFWGVKRC